jgi:hypothetical protein
MSFLFGLKNDSLADDAGIEPHKILGLLGAAGLVGKTYYVDSTHSRAGATQRHGTRTAPFSKLAWAITNLSAANLAKATFILMPGHAETITENLGADCDVDVDGINIIGVGTGTYQPAITVSSASGSTGARMTISGDNVSVTNVYFVSARSSLACFMYIKGVGTTVTGCRFHSPTSLPCLYGIDLYTNSGRTRFSRCLFTTGSTNCTNAIRWTAAAGTDLDVVEDCTFAGLWSTAALYSNVYLTTNTLIQRNTFMLGHATGLAIDFNVASTGMIAYNNIGSPVAVPALPTTNTIIDRGACACIENYATDTDGELPGAITPPAA